MLKLYGANTETKKLVICTQSLARVYQYVYMFDALINMLDAL